MYNRTIYASNCTNCAQLRTHSYSGGSRWARGVATGVYMGISPSKLFMG